MKAVEITRSWQGTRVTRWELKPLTGGPEGNPRAMARQALQEIFSTGAKGERTVILSVPSHRTMVHRGVLPFRDRKRNLQVVKFEAESLLPLPIEEVLVDFYPLREKGEGQEALIFAFPKKEMDGALSLLKEAGVEPEAVIPEAMALFSLVQHWGEVGSSNPAALLDIGPEKTTMIIWEGGKLTLARSIPFSNPLLSGGGELCPEGEGRSSWHRLAEEVSRSLMAYEGNEDRKSVAGIWLTGEGADRPDIGALLSQRTGRPVHPLAAGENVSLMLREIPAKEPFALAAALGAALLGSSGGSDQMNLRQEEFTSSRKAEKKKNRLHLLIAYGAFLLVLGIAAWGTEFYLKEKKYSELRAEIRKEFVQANPGVKKIVNEGQQMKTRLQEERTRVAAMGGMAAAGSPLDILRDLSLLIEPAGKIRITELIIETEAIEMSGEADSFDAVNRLKSRLEQSPSYKDVQLKTARASNLENVVEFKFQMGRRADG